MRLADLVRGLPGHPSHPPLTDATIGIYTFATVAGVLSALGIENQQAAIAWWLALVVGLVVTVPTALTGLADWLTISRGTPLWRTATAHLASMLTATVLFGLSALTGYGEYDEGVVGTGELVVTLAGFGFLTLGGWLGGTIVYVHGMRVLNLVEEPATRAASPLPKPEKELAEGD